MAGREGSTARLLPERWLGMLPSQWPLDLRVVRADGAYIWDDEGHKYLDLVTNGGVNVLGHSHPQFHAALASQLQELTSAHADFDSDAREDFIEALSVVVPDPLSKLVLTNSGSEAVEIGLRLACTATRRRRIVTMSGAYHGTTFLASLLSDTQSRAWQPKDVFDIVRIPFDSLDALERTLDARVAAVIVEPVQWEAGVRVPHEGYLAAVHALCKKTGAMLVVDEVQTALRTWPPLLSARQGVVPDVLCLGPSIANGFPMGATVIGEAVASKTREGSPASTAAGNPFASVAGAATLRAVAEPAMRVRLAESGTHLQARLRALRISDIKAVRGVGTMAAVELHASAVTIVRTLRENGVLVAPAAGGVIRMLPPSTVDRRQIDFAVEKLAAAILDARQTRRRKSSPSAEVELRGVAARRSARRSA